MSVPPGAQQVHHTGSVAKPCWIIAGPDGTPWNGDGDYLRHFTCAEGAAEALNDLPVPSGGPDSATYRAFLALWPAQLPHLCWTLECSTCEQPFGDDHADTDGPLHFRDLDRLHERAISAEWTTNGQGEWTCWTCTTDGDAEPRLIVTRGLPGAGKTTAALTWVAADPLRRARVGRDVLREHVFCTMPMLSPAGESELTHLQRFIVMYLLDIGRSVVVDDTNLPDARITEWADLATELAAGFDVWDLRDVPLAVCVARDLDRAAHGGRLVGADVITTMATTGRPTVTAEPDTHDYADPPWESR